MNEAVVEKVATALISLTAFLMAVFGYRNRKIATSTPVRTAIEVAGALVDGTQARAIIAALDANTAALGLNTQAARDAAKNAQDASEDIKDLGRDLRAATRGRG